MRVKVCERSSPLRRGIDVQGIFLLFAVTTVLVLPALAAQETSANNAAVPVNVNNFDRAETDSYFTRTVSQGAFGKVLHNREMTPLDKQTAPRTSRDTLYSSGIFDLEAAPVTVTLPDTGKRFMSMEVISEDHYVIEVVYAPGRYTYTKDKTGTRYMMLVIRTSADAENPADLKAANALQDAIRVEQASAGTFGVPNWDAKSIGEARDCLVVLGSLGLGSAVMFGRKSEVDPVAHLIGTAIAWGGNPPSAAVYNDVFPKQNDGSMVYRLTVKNVPVDGFWSISVYNAKGYFEKNQPGAYSVSSRTARPNVDGSITVQFGACDRATPNCLPTTAGWNYTVRMYRPQKPILNGSWQFPEAVPVKSTTHAF
jgi:hypothetical protein